jgi:hypothetical protein
MTSENHQTLHPPVDLNTELERQDFETFRDQTFFESKLGMM